MMITQAELYNILSYFLIYSCLGWVVEVAYQAITKGIVVNRGFLNGPVCPIYGFGASAILLLLSGIGGRPEKVNALAVFAAGVLLATAVELLGGWVLDKLFHARWWDYRDRKFNLNGYICPEFSFYWGVGVLILVRVIHPFVSGLGTFRHMPTAAGVVILALLYAAYIADVVVSVLIMVGLNRKFAELDELQRRMRAVSDKVSTKIGEDTLSGKEKVEQAKVEAALARAELRDDVESLRDSYLERKRAAFLKITGHRHFGAGRMLLGNPALRHRDYLQYIDEIRSELSGKNRQAE